VPESSLVYKIKDLYSSMLIGSIIGGVIVLLVLLVLLLVYYFNKEELKEIINELDRDRDLTGNQLAFLKILIIIDCFIEKVIKKFKKKIHKK
jgi:Na+-transporting methylmalonyl-CoA/oxaloacetate decarboxylase gamma subunit